MGRRGRSSIVDETIFFVTTTVVRFARVFASGTYCDILLQNIRHYQQHYHFTILGYVIMPSHFHWIIDIDPQFGTISDIMRDIKKYSAWDIMQALEENRETELVTLFQEEAKNNPRQQRRFWMSRFDDEVIRNSEMFRTKLQYIHDNPVRAGIVDSPEEYRYSSARNWILNDHSVLVVDTSRF